MQASVSYRFLITLEIFLLIFLSFSQPIIAATGEVPMSWQNDTWVVLEELVPDPIIIPDLWVMEGGEVIDDPVFIFSGDVLTGDVFTGIVSTWVIMTGIVSTWDVLGSWDSSSTGEVLVWSGTEQDIEEEEVWIQKKPLIQKPQKIDISSHKKRWTIIAEMQDQPKAVWQFSGNKQLKKQLKSQYKQQDKDTVVVTLNLEQEVIFEAEDMQVTLPSGDMQITTNDEELLDTQLLLESFERQGTEIFGDNLIDWISFGAEDIHLAFSQPVQIMLPVDLEDGEMVEIRVRHAGEKEFNNEGLYITAPESCEDSTAWIAGTWIMVPVQNSTITFFTCGASDFVLLSSDYLSLSLQGDATVQTDEDNCFGPDITPTPSACTSVVIPVAEYSINYGVSSSDASGLVIWMPLPTWQSGTVISPISWYNRTGVTQINPGYVFNSATDGGVYTDTWVTLYGVDIPASSVYRDFGMVPAGTNGQTDVALYPPRGVIQDTSFDLTAYVWSESGATGVVTQTISTTVNANLNLYGYDQSWHTLDTIWSMDYNYYLSFINRRSASDAVSPTMSFDFSEVMSGLVASCGVNSWNVWDRITFDTDYTVISSWASDAVINLANSTGAIDIWSSQRNYFHNDSKADNAYRFFYRFHRIRPYMKFLDYWHILSRYHKRLTKQHWKKWNQWLWKILPRRQIC